MVLVLRKAMFRREGSVHLAATVDIGRNATQKEWVIFISRIKQSSQLQPTW